MPALEACIIAPIWDQFSALLPDHDVDHRLGCHRPRIPDRVVFDKLVQVLVFGCAYWRIADATCSATTLRRRRDEWIAAGIMDQLQALVLGAYDRMIGLELGDLAVDGCITKAPCGGELAGRSPVDRGKQGLKRSTVTDATGVPLHVVSAGANRHDAPLLEPTLTGLDTWGADPAETTVHLDRGYDSGVTRTLLEELGFTGAIARKGLPAPIQAGKRWVVERTQSWMNGYGKLRRCTEHAKHMVDFYLFLAAAFVVTRTLIQRARSRYRWPGRPTTRRLK